MFAIFIFIAHRYLQRAAELFLTTFICTHIFQQMFWLIQWQFVSTLFMNECSLKINSPSWLMFFFFSYYTKFINLHVWVPPLWNCFRLTNVFWECYIFNPFWLLPFLCMQSLFLYWMETLLQALNETFGLHQGYLTDLFICFGPSVKQTLSHETFLSEISGESPHHRFAHYYTKPTV